MNWLQLYTACTPEERLELLQLMLRRIEARRERLILAGWGIHRDRRRMSLAHFIRDRRGRSRSQLGLRLLLAGTLGIFTWALLLVSWHIPPLYGALLVINYQLALIAVFIVVPHLRASRLSAIPKIVT